MGVELGATVTRPCGRPPGGAEWDERRGMYVRDGVDVSGAGVTTEERAVAFMAMSVETVERQRYPAQRGVDTVRVMFIEEVASDRGYCAGKGMRPGYRLMRAAAERAVAEGCAEMHLVVCNAEPQRHAVRLYEAAGMGKASARRGRVAGPGGGQVNLQGKPGCEYWLGPVAPAMLGSTGLPQRGSVREYSSLGEAPGAVRGSVREMYESAHEAADDGALWEEHPVGARHLVLMAATGASDVGARAASPGGQHVGWWERMCRAIGLDVWARATRLRAGERALLPRGDG